MASVRLILLLSRAPAGSCFLILLKPGISPSKPSSGPSFWIMRIWSRKSLKSNFPSCIRFIERIASSSFTASATFSTMLTMSPMPRMRSAMREGWNSMSWSSFSPSPAYLIGLPVTSRMESAAPPRASPSSFVSTMPVMPTASLKWVATETACWPVAASATRRVSLGFRKAFSFLSSSMSRSSISWRPAVSKIRTVAPLLSPKAMASRATLITSVSPFSGAKHGTSACLASVWSCSMAAGR